MFWLGVLIGIGLACVALWWLYGPDGVLRGAAPFDARAQAFETERATIDQMLVAEMAARHAASANGTETVDGTAREVVRRP